MRSCAKAVIELVAIVTVVAILLLLVATEYPEPVEMPAPPSTHQMALFASKCDGRVVLIRNELECR